jgi:hypothetical protein
MRAVSRHQRDLGQRFERTLPSPRQATVIIRLGAQRSTRDTRAPALLVRSPGDRAEHGVRSAPYEWPGWLRPRPQRPRSLPRSLAAARLRVAVPTPIDLVRANYLASEILADVSGGNPYPQFVVTSRNCRPLSGGQRRYDDPRRVISATDQQLPEIALDAATEPYWAYREAGTRFLPAERD